MVNLLSALTPNACWRGHLLLQVEPIGAMHVFHALAVPASAALLVGAFYLRRRRRVAWQLAFGLLCALTMLDLVKGLDVEEAALSAAGAGLLWWGRDAFTVRGDPGSCGRRPGAYRRSRPPPSPSPWPPSRRQCPTPRLPPGSTRRSTCSPGSRAPSTSATRRGTCRSRIGLLGVVALGYDAWLVFRPLAAPRALPDPDVRQAAGELVRRHGHDTLAFFKLRGDQQYLFSDDGSAFLGYRVEGGVMLCAGDPVGPAASVPALLDEAAAFAAVAGPAARRGRGELPGSAPGVRGARAAASLPG